MHRLLNTITSIFIKSINKSLKTKIDKKLNNIEKKNDYSINFHINFSHFDQMCIFILIKEIV